MADVRAGRHRWLVVAVLVVTAGCEPGGGGETSGAAEALVVAAGADTSKVEPPELATVAAAGGDVNAGVFETLVALSEDFEVEPRLALSWELRPPGTWRFHLRRGVSFHDGQPFDAAAVADNVRRIWGKAPGPLLLGPDSAAVVDAHTVDLTPTAPNLRLVEQLVHPRHGVRAPGTWAGLGTRAADTPTGTGPFRFAEYRQGEMLRVERFDGYWGPPAAARLITFRFLPDDATRMLELQAGRVHAAYDVPRQQASALAADPALQVVKGPVGASDTLLLNHRGTPPFDLLSDIRLRRAVALGIDRKAIVDTVWQGHAEVSDTLIPAPVLGSEAKLVTGHRYDPGAAGRLLDEAGWARGPDGVRARGGRRLAFTLVVPMPELQRPLPELVQAGLAQLGIAVTLDLVANPPAFLEKLLGGQGDLFAEIGDQNDANPIFLGALLSGVAGGFEDYAAWFGAGPAYDQLFARAVATADTDDVRRLAAEAMRIAVDDQVVVVPVAGIRRIWGLRAEVRGFAPHPAAAHQTWARVALAA